MKIKWTNKESREVPGVGLMEPGKEYVVDDDLGRALVECNLAGSFDDEPITLEISED